MAVRLRVIAQVVGQRALDGVNRSLTTMDSGARTVTRSLFSVRSAIALAFGGLIVQRFTSSVFEANDTIINIRNQLQAAGVAAEGIADAQAQVVALAEQSRASLEATGGLYARVLRSTRDLGISQQEGLDITRAFQQSLALSGATVQEATSASLQFGQALASGRLQGDELRSILENNSFFAQRFAQELGVGVGRLREMGAEGLLTSQTLADIALRIAPELNDRFEQLTPTFAQAGQLIRNDLVLALNEVGTTIRGLTGPVVDLADTIGSALSNAIRRVNQVIVILNENIEGIQAGITAIAGAITALLIPSIIRLSRAILVRLGAALLAVISIPGLIIAAVATIGAVVAVAFDNVVLAAEAFFDGLTVGFDQTINDFQLGFAAINLFGREAFNALAAGVTSIFQGIVDGVINSINGIGSSANELAELFGLDDFVEIPELEAPTLEPITVDTSQAMADIAALTEQQGVLEQMAMEASAAFGEAISAIGTDVVEAASSVQQLVEDLFTLDALPDITPPTIEPPGGDSPGEDMMANALSAIQMAFSFDDDAISEISGDFQRNLQTGLSSALNNGDFSSLGDVFLNSFTMSVNDQLATGISELFGGIFMDIISQGEGMSTGVLDLFGNLFSGIADSLSGLFGGGGGGGGLGGLLSAGLGLFGFQNGGIVPGPQGPGPDNTIAAVRSGELILNRAQQENLAAQLQQQPMVINQTLQVTGDVTSATRQAVRDMGNEISNTVQQRFNERGLLGR